MIKNIKSYLQSLCLVLILSRCDHKENNFHITFGEIQDLYAGKEEPLIDKWDLQPCSTPGQNQEIYCGKRNQITYTKSKDGFIVGITDLQFEDYFEFLESLGTSYKEFECKEYFEKSDFFHGVNIVHLQCFHDSNNEIVIAQTKVDGKVSYSIVGFYGIFFAEQSLDEDHK